MAELEPNKHEGEKGFKVALCNPEIVKASDEMASDLEGCLSIPGWVGEVPRHVSVTVKAQTPEGKRGPHQSRELLRPRPSARDRPPERRAFYRPRR